MVALQVTASGAGFALKWLMEFFGGIGVPAADLLFASTATLAVGSLLLCGIVHLLLTRVAHPLVTLIVRKTPDEWDDTFFNPRLLNSASALLVIVLLNLTFPAAFKGYADIHSGVALMCRIFVIVGGANLINALLSAFYHVFDDHTRFRIASLKGLFLMIQLVVWAFCLILVVSAIAHRNPIYIMSWLGASAAVLMLVFKDSILGVVAGIQLTFNDMLRAGDWISMPSHGINGIVLDVLLTAVKVQNYDMTIVTIPPYTLVSESFQNWRGMKESGGRRVKRAFNIDVSTIRPLTPPEAEALKSEPWAAEADLTGMNLTLFRKYLLGYLGKLALERPDEYMLLMVRELDPTVTGLPLEIYFFTAVTEWVAYENVQSAVTEHVIGMLPRFGLRLFQAPAGSDISMFNQNKQQLKI